MISERTKYSLCQYLCLQDYADLEVLVRKYMPTCSTIVGGMMNWLRNVVFFEANYGQVQDLINEIVRTQQYLRSMVSSGYVYDERWADLELCLSLDGYKVEGSELIPIDPTIEGATSVEDDLSKELRLSSLPEAEQVLDLLNKSAEDFRKTSPDYNGCLSNARVALQTLTTAIAMARRASCPGSFDETKWAQVLAYLRTSGFVTPQEEQGIGGVFTFVSPGAHSPVSLQQAEMARLGRSFVSSMMYFLVKTHNAGVV